MSLRDEIRETLTDEFCMALIEAAVTARDVAEERFQFKKIVMAALEPVIAKAELKISEVDALISACHDMQGEKERGDEFRDEMAAAVLERDAAEQEIARVTENYLDTVTLAADQERKRAEAAEDRGRALQQQINKALEMSPWIVKPIPGHSVCGHGNTVCFWCGAHSAMGHMPGCSALRPLAPPDHKVK